MQNPTVFEIIQEDTLRGTFRNTIRHFVKFLFNRLSLNKYKIFNDDSLLKKFIGQDEFILIFESIVQWSYLYKYNATFTEKFLSLQRFDSRNESLHLKKKHIILSLISLTFTPYIFKKLDQYYEYLEGKAFTIKGQDIDRLSSNEKSFYLYYENFKKLYQFAKILCWLNFACSSSYSSPVMLTLLRDMRIGYKNDDIIHNGHNSWLSNRLSSSISNIFGLAFQSSAFLIQFLDYWLSQSDVRQIITLRGFNVMLPSPIAVQTNTVDNSQADKNHASSQAPYSCSLRKSISPNLCPLCLCTPRNATAIASSGYIFCYACITGFVTEHSKCPISGFPATASQLIRIYD